MENPTSVMISSRFPQSSKLTGICSAADWTKKRGTVLSYHILLIKFMRTCSKPPALHCDQSAGANPDVDHVYR